MIRAARLIRSLAMVCLVAWAAGSSVPPAHATWSIIITDSRTNEVAIGSATCLVGFDLKRGLPVVRVERGAGAAQSAIDSNAKNRLRIWDGLIAGKDPADILAELAANDASHQSRQYGIVDTRGRAITFSGANANAYKGAVIGKLGTLTYAIQGNILTGEPVIAAAEQAVLLTPGGIPEKLMAAMEAAREFGGDGRCSCPGAPTGCGSPPPSFTKSAHIGFMITARRGDIDGLLCNQNGCANGTYYMSFNVLAPNASLPDPVFTLRDQFDAWRAGLIGVPDAIESTAVLSKPAILNTGDQVTSLTIEIKDWQGTPVDNLTAVVASDDDATPLTQFGLPTPLGNGRYELEITGGLVAGTERLSVIALQAAKQVILMPRVTVKIQDERADLNADGVVDTADLEALLKAFQQSPAGDIDGDGQTTDADLGILLDNV